MESVLVTGAQGLLGRHLLVAARARWPHARLTGLGRSFRDDGHFTHSVTWRNGPVRAYVPESLRVAYDYRRCDLRDPLAVRALVDDVAPDLVVHAAAALRDEPWPALLASNVEATAVLLTELADRKPRIVLVSSGSVYGPGDGDPPFREGACCRPFEPYGVTKRAAEDAARVLGTQRGMPLSVARVFNIVGAGLQERHLPAVLAARAAAISAGVAPRSLTVHPLTTTRDFVHVADAARACVALAEQAPDVYNIGSGVETPVRDVLRLAINGIGDVALIERPPDRPVDLPRAFADVSRLAALGLRPRRPLADSIAEMVEYYLRLG